MSSNPSAPVIDITVTNPGVGSSDERALVDTGAAMTLVPERLAEGIPLGEGVPVVVRGLFESKFKYRYVVDVTVGGMEFKSVRVIAAGGEALIGRNLINRWRMTLDGRNEALEIHS